MRIGRFAACGAMVALVVGSSARANVGGIFGRSGRTVGFTCGAAACHGAPSGATTVAFSIAPTNPDFPPIALGFVPGAPYTVTVTVSGGPGATHGFGFDANDGATRATDANVQVNTNQFRLADTTHTLAGSAAASWTFEWLAPATRNAVGFWATGTSGDGDATSAGDDAAGPVTQQVQPLPLEIVARLGNVNDVPGDPVPVLFVNGSRGDGARILAVPTGPSPMTLSIGAYPGAPAEIPYVVYTLRRENVAGDEVTIAGIGLTAFAFPPSGGGPVVAANTLGRRRNLGVPRIAPTPLGPGPILTVNGLPSRLAGARCTVQGLVLDSTAPSGAAVTNGIVLAFQ